MGYSPQGGKESDMTKQLTHTHTHISNIRQYLSFSVSLISLSGIIPSKPIHVVAHGKFSFFFLMAE